MKPLIIYHDHCTDGFGAAYAAWTVFGDDAEYLPMQYGNLPTPENLRDLVRDRIVYILDFSFPRPLMDLAFDFSSSLVWLDHHKTAFEMYGMPIERIIDVVDLKLSQPHYVTLDNNKSGALLAWEYFHPGEKVPTVIRHIDDRDRWQFKMRGSRAIHAALWHNAPWTFEQWSVMADDNTYDDLFSIGVTIVNINRKQIVETVRKAETCTITTGRRVIEATGLAVNTPTHISEVGNELAKACGTFGLVWYFDGATKRANCSLRSVGDYDVSAIAKSFGGGGHKNAAGFNVGMATLLKWLQG